MTTKMVPKDRKNAFQKFLTDNMRHLETVGKNEVLDSTAIIKFTQMAAAKNPMLYECTPLSIFGFIMSAKELGLRPGGARPEIHPVPFRSQKLGKTICTPIIDYRGLIKIARKGTNWRMFESRVVYENDKFKIALGTSPQIYHVPAEVLGHGRGAVIGFYAIATDVAGHKQFEYMSKEDVDKIRAVSRAKNAGPWVDWYEMMGKKSVLRRLCNLLEDEETSVALDIDSKGEAGLVTPQDFDVAPEEIVGLPDEDTPKTATEKLRDRVKSQKDREPGEEEQSEFDLPKVESDMS